MYLAIRDLRAAFGRFTLVGAVIALVALLGVLLSGLASGLVDDGISGLREQRLTHLVMQDRSGGVFSKSTLTAAATAPLGDLADVEHSNIGVSFFNAKATDGHSVDLVLFGVDADSFLVPRQDGREALAKPNTIVVSKEIAADGVKVGDELTLIGNETKLTVAGITTSGSYGHAPIAYTSLGTWQQALYGSDPRGRFSAIAINAGATPAKAIAAATKGHDLQLLTKAQAYDGSPGYSAETSTMTLIRTFLLVISALIVGAFFTVWSIQRTREIGLMKALGATDTYVLRDALGQLVIVITASVLVGSVLGYLLGLAVPAAVPFALHPANVAMASGLLIVTGLLGSVVTIRRIAKIDPLVALSTNA
jgi:putative ABC transport system permease protein